MPKDSQKIYNGLRLYQKKLSRKREPFSCPLCQISILSQDFENHCSEKHELNPRLCCVWCLGEKRWPSGEKWTKVDHLLDCWQTRLSPLTTPTPFIPTPDPLPFDMQPMDPPRDLFDTAFDPPPGAFDLPWPAEFPPYSLPYQNDPLNQAAACVQQFLHDKGAEWFHIMVRTLSFPSFLQALDADQGQSRLLPFACWCDGGEPTEARLRQHKHMIVYCATRGHFLPNVWKKIQPHLPPRKNFKCIHHEKIESAMHLINTIGYLSQRKSNCNFSFKPLKASGKNNHFYLFQCLPKHYRLPLVLQWDKGLLELLNQEFKNWKRDALVSGPLAIVNGKWALKIKHLPGIPLNMVLPVSKEYRPCPHPTSTFLHLIEGRKLFFEPTLPPLNDDAWLRTQAEGGNLFYHVVAEDHWAPRPFYQGLIYEFRPFVLRLRELEAHLLTEQRARLVEGKKDLLKDENFYLKTNAF